MLIRSVMPANDRIKEIVKCLANLWNTLQCKYCLIRTLVLKVRVYLTFFVMPCQQGSYNKAYAEFLEKITP